MKKIIVIFALAIFTFLSANAQTSVTIKTSAICGICKATIEKGLKVQKGIQSADLNLETKEVNVSFDDKKTNPNKIRKAIAKLGYDADDVKRNPKSFSKLPECCKVEGKMNESKGEGMKGTKEKSKKGCCKGESKKSCEQ
jgi:copper chaperone CopZ